MLLHKMGSRTSTGVFLPRSNVFAELEAMLQDPCAAVPMCLPMDFLESITRNFSDLQQIGRGGYGVVYKGVLQNGKAIAVKKLSDMQLDDHQFQNEVTYLIGMKHQNIVRLIGYCAESRWEATEVNRRFVLAEVRKRLLCFEYINNKSLDKHLSAESCGLEWRVRLEIIRGICRGLHYLHTDCNMVHMDLKPENVLLDDNMVPKIADFGISRLFDQQQSRIITGSRGGTLGYMAPEYVANGLISAMADMFSLGVIIIEVVTGNREYPRGSSEASSSRHFIETVTGNWRCRLEKAEMQYCAVPLDASIQQVNTCILTALKCVDPDPKKRPVAWDVLQMLGNAMDEESSRKTTSLEVNKGPPAASGFLPPPAPPCPPCGFGDSSNNYSGPSSSRQEQVNPGSVQRPRKTSWPEWVGKPATEACRQIYIDCWPDATPEVHPLGSHILPGFNPKRVRIFIDEHGAVLETPSIG